MRFNPILHYQYKDLLMLEAELEEDGTTELALEYLTVDLFVNDYLAVIGGPFRQNIHPS